jgi:hypothetical protein
VGQEKLTFLEASPLTSSACEALGSSTIEQGVSSNLLLEPIQMEVVSPLKTAKEKKEEKKT